MLETTYESTFIYMFYCCRIASSEIIILREENALGILVVTKKKLSFVCPVHTASVCFVSAAGRYNSYNAKQYKLSISSEVLIKLVKQRPCLWNKSLSEYKDKVSRDTAWTDIYRELEPDFDNCKNTTKRQIGIQVNKKWCNIRDAYVKARHNYRLHRTNKPYVHTKILSFLDPYISERSEIVEEKFESEDDGADNWFNETVYLEENESAAKKPKLELEIERDKDENESSSGPLDSDNVVALLTKMIQREEDEDRAFFKSIEPSVKGLSEDSKLEFRINVLKLIKDLKFRDRTGIQVNLKMTVDEDC